MKINILLAQTDEQKSKAFELVRKSYLLHFGLDLTTINDSIEHPKKDLNFKKEVLLVESSVDGKLLGSLSFMYPQKGILPCEYFFGFNLEREIKNKQECIEVGRFATSESCGNNPIVIIGLLLGIATYVEREQITEWVAVIKDNFFDFFSKINLPMKSINQKPILPDGHPLWQYIEAPESLHLFTTPGQSSSLTLISRFERYTQSGNIKFQF